jgi:hypothetical protein
MVEFQLRGNNRVIKGHPQEMHLPALPGDRSLIPVSLQKAHESHVYTSAIICNHLGGRKVRHLLKAPHTSSVPTLEGSTAVAS